jgi:very-short-patch-repair endonuclease
MGDYQGRVAPVDHARAMRRQPTPSERKLWFALRNWQVDGLKFRRQVLIGPYIADFFCPAARLVIEVDGATHAGSETDPRRDQWMRAQGLRVLRVWNNEVMGNLEGVLEIIRAAAREPLPPAPSRKGRGRRFARSSSPPPLAGGGRGEGPGSPA